MWDRQSCCRSGEPSEAGRGALREPPQGAGPTRPVPFQKPLNFFPSPHLRSWHSSGTLSVLATVSPGLAAGLVTAGPTIWSKNCTAWRRDSLRDFAFLRPSSARLLLRELVAPFLSSPISSRSSPPAFPGLAGQIETLPMGRSGFSPVRLSVFCFRGPGLNAHTV